MRLSLLLLCAAVLAAGCLGVPGHTEAIRSLTERSLSARARADAAAVYRLTDPDFRALCPLPRFRAAFAAGEQAGKPARLTALGLHFVNGEQAEGDVTLASDAGERRERWRYVKVGSRWYVYGDAAGCGVAP